MGWRAAGQDHAGWRLAGDRNGTPVVPPFVPSFTTDGPANVQRPITLNDWQSLAPRGIRVPAFFHRCQDAAGDLLDEVQPAGIGQLTAGPGLTYAQAIAGWTQKFVQTSEVAHSGAGRNPPALWDASRQSVSQLVYFQANAAGGARILLTIDGGNRFVEINNLGRLILVTSGGQFVVGGYNYLDGAVHPVYHELIAGAGIPGHSGAGIWRISTDKEQIVGVWELQNDDSKGLGGANAVGTGADCYYGFNAVWVGTDAEAMAVVGPHALLSTGFGWALAW